jgi:SAM-dependent methyltransferase
MRFFFREADRFTCYACDVDRKAISYLRECVPFVEAEATQTDPPLPYLSGHFDLIYSISVFTHLDRGAFAAWLKEIYRVTKPGGAFLVTLHGERAFNLVSNEPERRRLIRISEDEFAASRKSFLEEGFAWMKQPVGSTDIDTAQFGISFVSRHRFEDWISPLFDVVEYIDGEIGGWQDMAVLRRRGQAPNG